MIARRPAALGLLLFLAPLTACTSQAAAPPEDPGVAALPAYEPPSGAPAFCALLAGSPHLGAVPTALGTLTVDPSDAASRRALSGAVDDLRAVLEEVRPSVEHADLETAVEDLVDALVPAAGGRLDDDTGQVVGSALAVIGEQTQPVCGFPT